MAQPAPPQNLEQIAGQTQPTPQNNGDKNILKDVKKKGFDILNSIDGFCGDALRYGAGAYALVRTAPAIFGNLFAGGVFTALAYATAFIGTNLLYKTLTGCLSLAYNTFTDPLGSIKRLNENISNIVSKPLDAVKGLFELPMKFYKETIEGGNHNKYGKMFGMLVGGGVGLDGIAPGFANNIVGANGTDVVVGSIKDGASAIGAKTAGLMEIVGDNVDKVKDYLFMDDPLGSAADKAKLAFDSAFYK